jgi:uncharacterized protein YjbJ (UPF0337 family)
MDTRCTILSVVWQHDKVQNRVNSLRQKRLQMNTLSMKGNWKETAGKLKEEYANLTDDDLLFQEGKEEELLGRLQRKLGTTKEQLRKVIAKI